MTDNLSKVDNALQILVNGSDLVDPDTPAAIIRTHLTALEQEIAALRGAVSDLAQFIELSEYEDNDGVPLLLKHKDVIDQSYAATIAVSRESGE